MAYRFLVKKLSTSSFTGDFSGYFLRQTAARIGGSCGLSTAYDRTEGMFEKGRRGGDISSEKDEDKWSSSSYVAEKAKEGVKKTTEAAMNTGDTVKDAMDGAWKAAKETGQNITDAVAGDNDRIQVDETAVEVKEVNEPVDTAEYRAVEDLRNKAGGYDKGHNMP